MQQIVSATVTGISVDADVIFSSGLRVIMTLVDNKLGFWLCCAAEVKRNGELDGGPLVVKQKHQKVNTSAEEHDQHLLGSVQEKREAGGRHF